MFVPTLLALSLLLPARTVAPAPSDPRAAAARQDLDDLARWLEGTFTSSAQAARDPEFRDVRLVMARTWRERADGPWLYVEQAMASSLDAPYRQRVYQLVSRPDGSIESRVYTLPDPEGHAGAWAKPIPLADLTPASLTRREGCSIVLTRNEDGSFAGSTADRTCPSDLRGASWASSQVRVTADGIVSWDRGFDAAGAQVWGATKGGYEFVRARE